MDMRFTDFRHPFLYSIDSEVTQKTVSLVIEVEHSKDRKTGLNDLDKSQHCGIEDIAGANLVREVVRGNETVDGGFP